MIFIVIYKKERQDLEQYVQKKCHRCVLNAFFVTFSAFTVLNQNASRSDLNIAGSASAALQMPSLSSLLALTLLLDQSKRAERKE